MKSWEEEFNLFNTNIEKATEIPNLKSLDARLTNLYNNGIFTNNQFASLHCNILDRLIALEYWTHE